jgi:hypothetical protein
MRVSAFSLGQILTVECGFQALPQKLSGVLMGQEWQKWVLGNYQNPLAQIQEQITNGKSILERVMKGNLGDIWQQIPDRGTAVSERRQGKLYSPLPCLIIIKPTTVNL